MDYLDIGGAMAVLGESEQEGMVKSFQSSNCSRGFYTGHTDRRTEGLWRSEDSGQEVTGLRWRPGQPDDHLGVEDCGFYSVDTGDLVDHVCSWQFCPLCRMEDLVEFQLVGSCLNIADTLYLMLNSSYLLGYINTALHRDTVTNQWQIVNTFNNSLIAVMDGLDSFPLGINRWQFLQTNCTDPGFRWRTASLHRRVERPGMFCCGDGTCLDSDKVCDINQHCLDGSDERNCQIIHFPDFPYDSERAPTQRITEDEGEFIFKTNDVNVTLKVIDILDINEDESLVHLFFQIELRWFDFNLNYQFLNKFDDKNVIHENLAKNIWSPNLEFIHTKGGIQSGGKYLHIHITY